MDTLLRDPDAALQRALWGALLVFGLAAVWLVLTLVWVPEIDGRRPPEALLTYPSAVGQDNQQLVTETYDFVDRPLFLAGRRPVIVTETSSDSAPEQQATEVVSLDGFSLLGVFSSQGVGGVMLKSDDGGSMRLLVGEELQGMTLAGVESRGALFTAPERSGRPDVRLAMELGSIPMPVSSALPEATADDAEQEQPKLDPLSFAGMDAARRDRSSDASQRRRERDQAWRERLMDSAGKSKASRAGEDVSGGDSDKDVKSGGSSK